MNNDDWNDYKPEGQGDGPRLALANEPSVIARVKLMFDQMKVLGFKTFVVQYSGSGDEGNFYGPYFHDQDNVKLPDSFQSLTLDVAHDAVETQHSGWENNDGGNGTVYFDLSDDGGTIKVNHNDCYCDSEPDEISVFTGQSESDFGEGEVLVALSAMKAAGIVKVHVTYSGGGDSGDIDEMTAYFPAENGSTQARAIVETAEKSLWDAIARVVGEHVWSHHCGWWNGDGGSGDVYLTTKEEEEKDNDIAPGMPHIYGQHRNYFIEEESDNYVSYLAQAA